MKVLLDENLPHDLRHLIAGHEAITVAYLGWKGLKNGELLTMAALHGFDVRLTKDAGIAFERNPQSLPISVVIIRAKSNALDDIRPLLPKVLTALLRLQPRTLVWVA